MKKLKAERLERELTDDQRQIVIELLNSQAFKVFEIHLQNKFNREYKKLRKTRRTDESYERINGFLDGLEYVINCSEEFQGQVERPPKE